ncbi:MAG TPA: AI-2E family transporter [Blastocatellia bacterium]
MSANVRKRATLIFLSLVSIFALYLCFLLFRPFLKPLLSALVIAIVFFPAHRRVKMVIRKPSLAALLSTLLVMFVIIVPAILLVVAIANELRNLVTLVQQEAVESGGFTALINQLLERPLGWAGQYIDVSKFNPREEIVSRLGQISSFVAEEIQLLIGGLFSFLVNMAITLFTLFFIFREGQTLRRRIAAILPLTREQIERLFSGIENTIIGTVYGGLVVASVQGTLIGLALWLFGIPSALLWAVVAAFFALLPLVGTAIVWVPAALYLLATGHYVQAILLVGWGAAVVGSVDNVLRPLLMAGRVQMHTLLIFFAVFGGVTVFGFLGLFIGPVIMAVTITLLALLRDEARSWLDGAQVEDEAGEIAPEGQSSQQPVESSST